HLLSGADVDVFRVEFVNRLLTRDIDPLPLGYELPAALFQPPLTEAFLDVGREFGRFLGLWALLAVPATRGKGHSEGQDEEEGAFHDLVWITRLGGADLTARESF